MPRFLCSCCSLTSFTAHTAVASLMAGCNHIGILIVKTNEDSFAIKKEWARLKNNLTKRQMKKQMELFNYYKSFIIMSIIIIITCITQNRSS